MDTTSAFIGFLVHDDSEADDREELDRFLAELEAVELGIVIEKIAAS